jgi:hypothetical protein
MAKNHGTPGIDIVNIGISIFIKKISSAGGLYKYWNTAYAFKGADRRVYSSRNGLLRTRE